MTPELLAEFINHVLDISFALIIVWSVWFLFYRNK